MLPAVTSTTGLTARRTCRRTAPSTRRPARPAPTRARVARGTLLPRDTPPQLQVRTVQGSERKPCSTRCAVACVVSPRGVSRDKRVLVLVWGACVCPAAPAPSRYVVPEGQVAPGMWQGGPLMSSSIVMDYSGRPATTNPAYVQPGYQPYAGAVPARYVDVVFAITHCACRSEGTHREKFVARSLSLAVVAVCRGGC